MLDMHYLIMCLSAEDRRQRAKRKNFRARKKAKKAAKWEEMCNESLKRRWWERMQNFKLHQEPDIKERERECNNKWEVLATALEKKSS